MFGLNQTQAVQKYNPKFNNSALQHKGYKTPLELSEKNLTEFLALPKKTKLAKQQDFLYLAPFEVVARSKGKLIYGEWVEGISPYHVIHELRSKLPAIDAFQLTLVTGRATINVDRWRETLSLRKTGRFGLEVSHSGTNTRVSPLQSIATNQPLSQFFTELLKERQLSPEEFFKSGGQLNLLECRQFLLQCGKLAKSVETYRANIIVTPGLSPRALSERLISGISRWFIANQGKAGDLPYKYWPSSGIYSTADNPIRRFMASVAFNRMAQALDRSDMKLAARKNLQFNLTRFYRKESDDGLIFWDGSVKLGALAMAALAILESPFRHLWNRELGELHTSIDKLWQPSGAFRTFLLPSDRNDNQNFYPGEALLFWATSLRKNADPTLMSKTLKSSHYYRGHFRKHPNPAFVPWHSQAAAILFGLTGDVAFRDFVFEMNDWLLSHQQWGQSVDKDHWGRFYSPGKPEYGPPHASATGVYLEGLVDALDLARQAKDEVREATYNQAIERGIRSLAQLQFHDDLSTYYVFHKQRVIGALRTETYNNEIRIDNLQHALMALLRYRSVKNRDPQFNCEVI